MGKAEGSSVKYRSEWVLSGLSENTQEADQRESIPCKQSTRLSRPQASGRRRDDVARRRGEEEASVKW